VDGSWLANLAVDNAGSRHLRINAAEKLTGPSAK
jgi:hypothetical protein